VRRSCLGLGALLVTAAAHAAEPPVRADGRLPAAVVDKLVGKLVPLTFELPGDPAALVRVTMVEARYCGTVPPGRGRLVAVLRPEGARAPRPLFGGHDCQDPLDQIARRGGGEPVAVVEVLAAWAPSQLRLSLGEVATAGDEAGALAMALAHARTMGPLAIIATSALGVEPGGASRGPAPRYDLTVAFGKGDVIAVSLTATGRPPDRQVRLDPSGAAGDAAVSGTYGFVNALVALYTRDEPFTLPVEGQTVEIRALQVTGGEGALTLEGRAQLRGIAEVAHLTIAADGADLTISEVKADPDLEDCGSLPALSALGCRARNAARGAAAAALAASLTTRYRGEPVRSLTRLPPVSFEVGGRRFDLHLTPSRLAATRAGVVLSGQADLDPG
jgi:hypothetical protein